MKLKIGFIAILVMAFLKPIPSYSKESFQIGEDWSDHFVENFYDVWLLPNHLSDILSFAVNEGPLKLIVDPLYRKMDNLNVSHIKEKAEECRGSNSNETLDQILCASLATNEYDSENNNDGLCRVHAEIFRLMVNHLNIPGVHVSKIGLYGYTSTGDPFLHMVSKISIKEKGHTRKYILDVPNELDVLHPL